MGRVLSGFNSEKHKNLVSEETTTKAQEEERNHHPPKHGSKMKEGKDGKERDESMEGERGG